MPPLFVPTTIREVVSLPLPPLVFPRTAARLRRDAEQHARSIEESLEAEYFDRHSATIAERDKHAAEAAASQNKSSRLGKRLRTAKVHDSHIHDSPPNSGHDFGPCGGD